MRLSALLLRQSRFPRLLLFLALVGLLFRLLLLGLRLLGLAPLPAGQLPERALDAASGLLGRVAHRLGGALDAASGLLGRVAHRLGGALDAASGLLGRVAHRLGGALDRLGGALDGGPADLAKRLRTSGQPVGYGGHPAEHGLRCGLLRGLHQRAANLLHDLRGLLGPRHWVRPFRAMLIACGPAWLPLSHDARVSAAPPFLVRPSTYPPI